MDPQLVLAPKPHFLAALLMFMFITWMAVEDSRFTRGLLIVPIFTLFFCFLVFYGMEVSLAMGGKQNGGTSTA
jgi:hypothetical protein